ncbi:MAG TPA: STAS domain-containing protein [Candidatus Eisenbacteria bacterium]|nr:STAS domain-containing protein [Candidatus Eisenbacteria bacterium]
MRVDVQPDPAKRGYRVLPFGPIDSDTYVEFQDKLKPLLSAQTQNLLIDLSRVDYISSAGLGVLFTTKKFLIGNGGELYFCNLKPQIAKLFEVVKALPKETLFQSNEEADQYFYKIMNDEINRQKGIEPA